MKLSPEQRAVIREVCEQYLKSTDECTVAFRFKSALFSAGYRLGFEAAREAAAAAVQAHHDRICAEPLTFRALEICRDAIRAIPLPGADHE